ncbi:MAG TPA: HEAT repeat domain-containing protein [Pirellulales bacterium]|nr:HEAT repeat domain-containing protein [Pirellulales bacterium]
MHFRLRSRASWAGIVLAAWAGWLCGASLQAQSREQPAVAGAEEASVKEQESGKPAAKTADKERLPGNLQRTAVQRIKGKKPEARLEAVRELAEHPCEDAAKILVLQGLTSKFEEVRKASYETLLEFKNNEQVCDYLFDTIKKDMKKGMPRDGASAVLGVVLAADSPSVQKQAEAVLEEAAKQPKGGLLLLVTLADGLGQQGDPTSLATLLKLSKLPLFENEFAVRRSVVLALTNVQEPEAVDALIDMLGQLQGEVRGDIARYLTSISGEQHELDAAAWLEWWKANREGFQFPLRGQKVVVAKPKPQSMSQQYYGIPIYAERLVFVIDTSGSMRRGGRIETAKRELMDAINALPEGVSFNVLAFNERVFRWRRKLLIASPENKQKAVQFVEQQGLGRATASYDALEAALDLDAEAIYFLTDGAPHGGKVTQPAEIVDVLSRLNHTRRVTINSIGIGVGPEGNLFDTFLKTLSEKNYGEYRRVDE